MKEKSIVIADLIQEKAGELSLHEQIYLLRELYIRKNGNDKKFFNALIQAIGDISFADTINHERNNI